MIDLGTLGGAVSDAWSINDLGQVVGHSYTDQHDALAFLYESGTMTNLGTLAGGDWSVARDINESGQVVGQAEDASGQIRAFLYDSETMIDLGTFGGNESVAWEINNSGQVVGRADNTSGQRHAFLYDSGTMIELNDLLPPGSGWDDLQEANGINNNGQIVGSGYIDGEYHAYLMTPVPEPSTLALLGASTLCLLFHTCRRRRRQAA